MRGCTGACTISATSSWAPSTAWPVPDWLPVAWSTGAARRQDNSHAPRAEGAFPAVGHFNDPIRGPSPAVRCGAGTGGGPWGPDPAAGGGQVAAIGEGRRWRTRPLAQPVSYTHLRAHETVLDL